MDVWDVGVGLGYLSLLHASLGLAVLCLALAYCCVDAAKRGLIQSLYLCVEWT